MARGKFIPAPSCLLASQVLGAFPKATPDLPPRQRAEQSAVVSEVLRSYILEVHSLKPSLEVVKKKKKNSRIRATPFSPLIGLFFTAFYSLQNTLKSSQGFSSVYTGVYADPCESVNKCACITKNGPEVPVDGPSASWLPSLAILLCSAAFLNCGDTPWQLWICSSPQHWKSPTAGNGVTHKAGPWLWTYSFFTHWACLRTCLASF